jgi:hypothetical protein
VIVALVFASPTVARRPIANHDPCHGQRITTSAAAQFTAQVWRLPSWERAKPKRKTIAAWHHKLACAAGPGHRRAMKERWRRDRRAFYRHRAAEREREALTPYCEGGRCYAIPVYIVECESGGDYGALNASSGAGGAYQVLPSTWEAYGGQGAPQDASRLEQDRIAGEIWADSERSAWACG